MTTRPINLRDSTTGRHCDCSGEGLQRLIVPLALVLLLTAGAGDAEAGCGDYLYRRGVPVVGLQTERHLETTTTFHDTSTLQAARSKSHVPCSGPSCHQAPVSKFPGMPFGGRVDHDRIERAIIGEPSQRCSNSGDEMLLPQSERGACYEPAAVFRPPE